MGCARWTGVPLKAVLDKAGVKAGAVEVAFTGSTARVIPETPDFAKSLKLDHARDGQVMLAWGMNGQDLPWLNGYPLRLVVPGFYGTYWVKHLESISVLDKPFDGFWMQKAYRIPDNDCACTQPGKAADKTVPINRFTVRSFLTNLADGADVKAGARPCAVSPSTGAPGSSRWRSRPMTARPGRRRNSGRISAPTPSGLGPSAWTCRRARMRSGYGPRATTG